MRPPGALRLLQGCADTGTEVFTEWVGASTTLAPANAPNGRATIAVLAAETSRSDAHEAAKEEA